MKTTYLLLSGPMPSALIENRKTQTRRIVKPQPDKNHNYNRVRVVGIWHHIEADTPQCVMHTVICPYGQPGDQLVFLSTWAAPKEFDSIKPLDLPKDVRIWSVFDGTPKPDWCGKSRPGRFMPGWMRHRMPKAELIAVRVERLQDISEHDAIDEGIEHDENGLWKSHNDLLGWTAVDDSRISYRTLWEAINGIGSWEQNPYVWVIEFKRL